MNGRGGVRTEPSRGAGIHAAQHEDLTYAKVRLTEGRWSSADADGCPGSRTRWPLAAVVLWNMTRDASCPGATSSTSVDLHAGADQGSASCRICLLQMGSADTTSSRAREVERDGRRRWRGGSWGGGPGLRPPADLGAHAGRDRALRGRYGCKGLLDGSATVEGLTIARTCAGPSCGRWPGRRVDRPSWTRSWPVTTAAGFASRPAAWPAGDRRGEDGGLDARGGVRDQPTDLLARVLTGLGCTDFPELLRPFVSLLRRLDRLWATARSRTPHASRLRLPRALVEKDALGAHGRLARAGRARPALRRLVTEARDDWTGRCGRGTPDRAASSRPEMVRGLRHGDARRAIRDARTRSSLSLGSLRQPPSAVAGTALDVASRPSRR